MMRFEIIDADGSGTLHVGELVHGLLKIRGDIKRLGDGSCIEGSDAG